MTRDSAATVRLVMAGDNPEQAEFPMEAPVSIGWTSMHGPLLQAHAASRSQKYPGWGSAGEFRRRLNEDESSSGSSDFVCYSDAENGKRAMPYISLGLLQLFSRCQSDMA